MGQATCQKPSLTSMLGFNNFVHEEAQENLLIETSLEPKCRISKRRKFIPTHLGWEGI